MRNLKKIIAPAVAGFALSFLISLIATKGNFGRALLRGLIFALVFAALFFLIDLIFNKFLDGAESSSVSSKKSDAGLGAKVDITLSDEELSDDGEDLKFSVGQNKVGLNTVGAEIPQNAPASVSSKSDAVSDFNSVSSPNHSGEAQTVVAEKSKTSAVSSESVAQTPRESAFRPVPLGSSETQAAPSTSPSASSKVSDLDSLPDISDFNSELGAEENDGGGNSEGMLNDTEFSGSNNALYNRKKPGDEVSSGHDAATLAKAIQTILKREE